jgi:hypothetical protein
LEKIKESDRKVEQIARKDYPETELLQQVSGVEPLIALTFVLTVEDKDRFQKSRDIGGYVGLRPRRGDSGESQPQLHHEGRGFLSAEDVGTRSTLHSEPPRAGYGPEAMGSALGRTRRKTSEEEGRCSCGTEARHFASSAVGNSRSLRAVAKCRSQTGTEEASGVSKV